MATSLIRKPLGRLYRGARTRACRLLFERGQFDTSEIVTLDKLGLDGPGREAYEPSGWLFLRRALPRREVGPDDVFIDIGSGMGRVVYIAARDYPFRRAIGVEISEELTERARQNALHNSHRLKCKNVEFVAGDAGSYSLPDDVSVIYMFNPFRGKIFQSVLAEIVASLDRAPRRLRVVYGNPTQEEAVVGTDRFELVRRVPMRRRKTPFERPWISVYVAEGSRATGATAAG